MTIIASMDHDHDLLPPVQRGRFVTFEGGEGSGKSTQIRLLADRLEATGHMVLITREPGGSPTAEKIRTLLLSGAIQPFGTEAEAVLFAAARIDHCLRTIRPALDSGAWVLCDRFIDSTRVYQGLAGVSLDLIRALERVTVEDLLPDLTLILDLPADVGLARAHARRGTQAAIDRFEGEPIDVHRQRRDAFLAIAQAEPQRCVVVDANGSREAVAEAVWRTVAERLTATAKVEAA